MKNDSLKHSLRKIWEHYQLVEPFKNEELKKVLDRNYCFSEPEKIGKIVIVGINPSYKKDNHEAFSYNFQNAKHPYFTILRNSLPISVEASYLDLFYYRYTIQSDIQKLINGEGPLGLSFMVDQLQLTKEILEDAKPKLILVMNKGAWAYFGYHEHLVWMGYTFEELKDINLNEGKLLRITGLKNSIYRILPEIQTTNLVGTVVYFSRHLNRVPEIRRNSVKEDIFHIQERFNI